MVPDKIWSEQELWGGASVADFCVQYPNEPLMAPLQAFRGDDLMPILLYQHDKTPCESDVGIMGSSWLETWSPTN